MKRLTTHPILALTAIAILSSVVSGATNSVAAQAGELTPLKLDRLDQFAKGSLMPSSASRGIDNRE